MKLAVKRMKKEGEYADNKNAGYFRKFYDNIQHHIDVRICGNCQYAFISRMGWNVCGECFQRFLPLNGRPTLKVRGGLCHIRSKTVTPKWVTRPTKRPRYAVPNIDTPLVQMAMRDAFEKFEERILGVGNGTVTMPRIEGLGKYPLVYTNRRGGPSRGR